MIGLEIHSQLTTLDSKLFCSCKADYRAFEPNRNICPICAGMPGSLPLLNKSAVKKAATIAMALNCVVPKKIAFFRKNYFYPDLPKNYQITQLDIFGPTSIGSNGSISINDKEIKIRRVQLEEDPGRLVYQGNNQKNLITLVDYNRAGCALVEIVTEPDFENPRQVRLFLNLLSDLLKNLKVSDPTLEGAMRADGNVSIKDGPKVEIKNIGSFHDLEKAIHYEITRQESITSRGLSISSETRHWDDKRKITVSARKKEQDQDYRYFLEGDIPWIKIKDKTIQDLKREMPESIISKKQRYISRYHIAPQVAEVLSGDVFFSDLFDAARNETNTKDMANLITTDLMGLVDTREKRNDSQLTSEHLAKLVSAIQSNVITRNLAKTALQEMINTGKNLDDIIQQLDLGNVSDKSQLDDIINEIIISESKAVSQAKTNPQTINYLVGIVMKKTKGKADPKVTLDLLNKKITELPS